MTRPIEETQPYESYLELGRILGGQHPRSSHDPDSELWASEHFFIVVHQVIELLFRQALIDLSGAAAALQRGSWSDGTARLRRVIGALKTVDGMFGVLRQNLRREEFLTFRPALGRASGIQSSQYRDLRNHLGLQGGDRPGLAAAYADAIKRTSASCIPSIALGCLIAVMDELGEVWEGVWSLHCAIAAEYLGHTQGTGGSAGVSYLRALGPQRPFAGTEVAGISRADRSSGLASAPIQGLGDDGQGDDAGA